MSLNNKPALIKAKPFGGTTIAYCQFRRRHDYPPHKNKEKRSLVRSTPLIIDPPNKTTPWGEHKFVTINLDGGTITPLIKKNNDCWSNLPRILNIGGFVVDRKNIDLGTNLYEKLQKYDWHRGNGISKRL